MKIEKFNIPGCKYISSTTGRPSKNMSDELWQETFKVLQTMTIPIRDTRMRKPVGSKDYYSGDYKGMTQFQQYCSYINDILKVIRSGETDYCHYIYQIEDLLKYERSTLKTEYLPADQCWAVWLQI